MEHPLIGIKVRKDLGKIYANHLGKECYLSIKQWLIRVPFLVTLEWPFRIGIRLIFIRTKVFRETAIFDYIGIWTFANFSNWTVTRYSKFLGIAQLFEYSLSDTRMLESDRLYSSFGSVTIGYFQWGTSCSKGTLYQTWIFCIGRPGKCCDIVFTHALRSLRCSSELPTAKTLL